MHCWHCTSMYSAYAARAPWLFVTVLGPQVVAGAGAGRHVASKIEAVPAFEPRWRMLPRR